MTDVTDVTDAQVIDAMRQFGGGFIQQLVKLYQHADEENRRRIKTTWVDAWERYAELVKAAR
jgi:hypothetical protein